MSRSLKIQEFFIQIVILWFALLNYKNLNHRPPFNKALAVVAVLIICLSLCIHLWNFLKNDKYFSAQKLTQKQKLWVFLGGSTMFILFSSFILPWFFFYLCPLMLLYPAFYFFQHKWFPRAVLLAGLVLVTYSQMSFSKNDSLHMVVRWMTKKPERFNPKIIDSFDKKSLTPYQARDVAFLLVMHPNESLRNYKKAIEFAKIGLKKTPRSIVSYGLADVLTCAYLGEDQKQLAQNVIDQYQVDARQEQLDNNEHCELERSERKPASVQKRKNKYYF
ncbi:hypothetical protein K2X05_07150 [bacterium]|nr:hypothetical protein [bacterium]